MKCSTKGCRTSYDVRVCLKCHIPLCFQCQKVHARTDHIFSFPKISFMADYCDLHNRQYTDICLDCDELVCQKCLSTGHLQHQQCTLYTAKENCLQKIEEEKKTTSRKLTQITDEIEKREGVVNKIATEVESKLERYKHLGRGTSFTKQISNITDKIQGYLKELKRGGHSIFDTGTQLDKLKICKSVYEEILAWQKHILDQPHDRKAAIIEKCRLYNDLIQNRIAVPSIPTLPLITECTVRYIEPTESEIQDILFRIYIGNYRLAFTDETVSTRTEPTTNTREDNCNQKNKELEQKNQELEKTLMEFQETLQSMCADMASLVDACNDNRNRLPRKTLQGSLIGPIARKAAADFTKLLFDVFSLYHSKNNQWEECEKEIEQLKSQLTVMKKEKEKPESRVSTRLGQFDKSQDRLYGSEKEHSLTRQEVERLRSNYQDIEEKLRKTEHAFEREIKEKNNEIEDLKTRLSRRDQLDFSTRQFEKSKKEAGIVQERLKNEEELKELRDQINAVTAEKKELENRLNGSAAQHGRTQQEVVRLKSQLKDMEKKLMWTESELKRVKEDLHKTEHYYKTQVEELRDTEQDYTKDIQSKKKEIDDLKNRLSQVAGAKLTKGNSSIADLGDRFRPTRIAELYSEMYDNEWTEAVDVLTEKFKWDEDTVVHHLFITLQACYESCLEVSAREMNDIVQFMFRHVSADKIDDYAKCHPTELKQLHDVRKGLAVDAAKSVAKDICTTETFKNVVGKYHGVTEDLMNQIINHPYFEKCSTICWLMVVQDPRMVIDREITRGTLLDKEMYRAYTKSGSKMLFSVWPALFLHEGGPLLLKGVAQLY